MTKPNVFLTRRLPPVAEQLLTREANVEVWAEPLPPSPEVLRAKVARCDGLLSLLTEKIDAELLEAAPLLRVISNMAVGVNNIDLPAASKRGIAVGNTPGVLTESTADLTVALLLAVARKVVESHDDSQRGAWKTWEPLGYLGLDLVGKTAGIVGLGRIGSAVARRLHRGWDMSILYTSRNPRPEAEIELSARRVPFDELLALSDFVIVMTDLNPSTQFLFDRRAFQKMKRTAVFINSARGPLHRQADLIEALQAEEIFGAGLDVTDPEPPPPGDPIYRAPRLVLTPHIASATESTRSKMAEMAARNVLAGLAGDPLPFPVNPEVPARPPRTG
jgi:glyoxylate reductase